MSFAWSEIGEDGEISECADWNTPGDETASETVESFYNTMNKELGGLKNRVVRKLDDLVQANERDVNRLSGQLNELKSHGRHDRRPPTHLSFDSELASAGSQTSRFSLQRNRYPTSNRLEKMSEMSHGNISSTSTKTEQRANLSSRRAGPAPYYLSMSETNSILDDSPTVSAVCSKDMSRKMGCIDEQLEACEIDNISDTEVGDSLWDISQRKSMNSQPDDERRGIGKPPDEKSGHELVTVSKHESDCMEEKRIARVGRTTHSFNRQALDTSTKGRSVTDDLSYDTEQRLSRLRNFGREGESRDHIEQCRLQGKEYRAQSIDPPTRRTRGEGEAVTNRFRSRSVADHHRREERGSRAVQLVPKSSRAARRQIQSDLDRCQRKGQSALFQSHDVRRSCSDSISDKISFDAPTIATPVHGRDAPSEVRMLESFVSVDGRKQNQPDKPEMVGRIKPNVPCGEIAVSKNLPLVRAKDLVMVQNKRILSSFGSGKIQVDPALSSPTLKFQPKRSQQKNQSRRVPMKLARYTNTAPPSDIVATSALPIDGKRDGLHKGKGNTGASQREQVPGNNGVESRKEGLVKVHSNKEKQINSHQMAKSHQVRNKVVIDPYGDRGLYTGQLVKDRPHGHGTMKYEDKRLYIGEWRYGRWHGAGRAIFTNGDVYVGEYKMDQRHGFGRYEWADKRVYDGEFYEDQRHGSGTYTWPDGSSFVGEFVLGQRNGSGVYTFTDGSMYSGGWKNGYYEGQGECRWVDGRTYSGEWARGHANGHGIETRADGTIRHMGLWKDDRPVRTTE